MSVRPRGILLATLIVLVSGTARSSRRHQGRSRLHGEEGGPPINSEGADKVYAEISDDTVVCGGVYQS